MNGSPVTPRQVSIGPVTFDLERREIVGGSGAVALSSNEFKLMALLVSKRPCVASKDEIRDALWPRTIVTETSLTTLVKELRTKLGQTGRHGPIRTVHGYGYALVEEAPGSAPGPAPRLVRGNAEIRVAAPELILGRKPGTPGTIDDSSVSRRHARLGRDGRAVCVVDLGSKNGTFVNGVRVSAPTALEDGDELRLGLVTFVYRALSYSEQSATKTAV